MKKDPRPAPASVDRRKAIAEAVSRMKAAAPPARKPPARPRRSSASKAKRAPAPIKTGGEFTEQTFWDIIASTRPDRGFDQQIKRLSAMLTSMPVAEVQAFDGHFIEFVARLEDNDELREMAIELGGGAGDDAWSDFKSWLVSRGRDIYRAGSRRPTTLRAVAAESDDVEFGEFGNLAGEIIEKRRTAGPA